MQIICIFTRARNSKRILISIGTACPDYFGNLGARMYDAQLGRFHVQDRFAEKYNFQSPNIYAGNDPIKNIDVNGDSLTANAWKWANELISKANNQIKSNNKTIAKLESKGKTDSKRYKRLKETNAEFTSFFEELAKLNNSNQWYDVKISSGLKNENGDDAAGITSFDFNTGMVVMTVDMVNYDIEAMAHEFKHSYQFEVGELDLNEDGGKGLLYGAYTEEEANKRGDLFGTSTFSYERGSIYKTTTSIYNRNQISDAYTVVKKRKSFAYRLNNQTIIWTPRAQWYSESR